MSLGRYGNKRDSNESDIFATLRSHGFSVHALDTPADALVGFKGRTYLVEVKVGNAKFTKTQVDFQSTWNGDYIVLRSVDEAEAWVKEVRQFAHSIFPSNRYINQ